MPNALRVSFREKTGRIKMCHWHDRCHAVATEVALIEELDADRHVTRRASFEVCEAHAHKIDQERQLLLQRHGGEVGLRLARRPAIEN